jgi:hypothetical protein
VVVAGAIYEWWLLYQALEHDVQELPTLPVPISSSREQDINILRHQFGVEEVRDA